jgi:hypothetical protein
MNERSRTLLQAVAHLLTASDGWLKSEHAQPPAALLEVLAERQRLLDRRSDEHVVRLHDVVLGRLAGEVGDDECRIGLRLFGLDSTPLPEPMPQSTRVEQAEHALEFLSACLGVPKSYVLSCHRRLRESSPSVQPSSGEAAARKVLQKLQAENLRLEALRDFKRATRIFNELEEEVRAHGLKDKG